MRLSRCQPGRAGTFTRCQRGFTACRWVSCSMPSWLRRFFIFGTCAMRRVGFASLVLLQLLIAATGNYGFFNLLSMVLCAAILDDQDWEWLSEDRAPLGGRAGEIEAPRSNREPSGAGQHGRCRGEWWWARWGPSLSAVTADEMLERIWPGSECPFAFRGSADWVETVAQHEFVRPVRGDDNRAS